jgi:spermidine synthase
MSTSNFHRNTELQRKIIPFARPLLICEEVCLHSHANSGRKPGREPIKKRVFLSWYFIFFFISGFCSVLYELIWLRLSMAQFGVTTAMVSIVLSVFMAGLGLGSWVSGRWLGRYEDSVRFPALPIYALIELLIGVSAIVVPLELRWGRGVWENFGLYSSFAYYAVSGLWVACALIPWCFLMGATIPVGMLAIRRSFAGTATLGTAPAETARSFSYLYMANVIGAVAGTRVPLYLIELLGFHGTLKVGAACNVLIAVCVLVFFLRSRPPEVTVPKPLTVTETVAGPSGSANILLLLFATGLSSMGMEVVWVRQFTPYLGTVVYSFADILGLYLISTFVGSLLYRRWSRHRRVESSLLWTLLALSAFFPLITASPDVPMAKGFRLVLGIALFPGLLGFITPMLVDRWSGGHPGKAGSAYAINVVGCILGPLLAGFLLLPHISERWALVVLAAPWLLLGLRALAKRARSSPLERAAAYALLPLAVVLTIAGSGYQDRYRSGLVLRDSTATVIATGSGMQRQLLVNGYGMTALTPITKMMAHLPLAFLDHPPHDALDICFGMGTTFRSLLTWDINTTAVELVPSVPRAFGYFHADAPEVLRSPLGQVVIDDGRRYLERTVQHYDLITIDPPPPVEAAGSSLLYSQEFYEVARRRLRPDGILQQWLPYGDAQDFTAVARALQNSFPYIRAFRWNQKWGYHFLASNRPFPDRTAEELARRLPTKAATDLVEWGPEASAERQFAMILQQEVPVGELLARSPSTPTLSDDRPVNEYYALRRARRWRWLPAVALKPHGE